jgi:hypothetical protein
MSRLNWLRKSRSPKLELPQHAADPTARAAEVAAQARHYRYERDNPLGVGMLPWMKKVPAPESQRPENSSALARLTGVAVRLWSYRLTEIPKMGLALRAGSKRLKREGADPFAFFHDLYGERDVPWVARGDTWKTDEAFGYQRLVGMTPMFLEGVTALPPEFKVRDEDVQQAPSWPKGATLTDMIAARRLWMVRHTQTAGIEAKPGRVVCSPQTLFLVNDAQKLVPVAIQLFVDSDVILTPADDVAPDGTRTNRWLVAKMFCTNIDALTHVFFSHSTLTHLLPEAYWAAACRNLSDQHPLKALLKPHTEATHLIGEFFRTYYATPNGELARLHQATLEGIWVYLRRRYAEWSFADLDIPAMQRQRGWDHPGALPGYLYRDDTRKHYDLLTAYLTRVTEVLYPSERDLLDDVELQGWVRELADPVNGCGLRGLPVDADGRLTTREQLVKLLAGPLFQAIVQHSHFDTSGYAYFGFAPNMPLSLYLDPPRDHVVRYTEEQIAQGLPPLPDAALQFALPQSNYPFHPKPRAVFFPTKMARFTDDFMAGLPPEQYAPVKNAVANWQREIEAYADFQEARDRTLWTAPYDLLNARNMSNTVWY